MIDLSKAQSLALQVVWISAVVYDSGMLRPESQMTLGSSISTQSLYCWLRRSKCLIQLTRFFSVGGAFAAHIGGSKPLKNEFANESRSLDMPISPLRARFSSIMEPFIVLMRMLYRSNSCSNTV